MTRSVTLKLQHWSHATPKQVTELRSRGAALADFLTSPDVPRVGLGVYWHAVPYLIKGVATGLDEPHSWFIEGGATIGKNDAGDVRYLSPTQVASLARALNEEEPDELGYDHWDEGKMDALGVYPGRWVRDGENADQLGTIREEYSYLRSHVEAARKKKVGMVIRLTHQTITDDDEPTPVAVTPASQPPPPPAPPPGELVLAGGKHAAGRKRRRRRVSRRRPIAAGNSERYDDHARRACHGRKYRLGQSAGCGGDHCLAGRVDSPGPAGVTFSP